MRGVPVRLVVPVRPSSARDCAHPRQDLAPFLTLHGSCPCAFHTLFHVWQGTV